MKHILAFGSFIVCGALAVGACTASDSENEPDPSTSAGGSGGSTTASNSGGNTSSSTADSTSAGGTTGSGGEYTAGAAGEAGMPGTVGTGGTWMTTTGTSTETSTTGEGGSAGAPIDCHGDDPVTDLPSCDDLPYADVVCDQFEPPEPLGFSLCKEWAANATPEAFETVFACLDDIDAADPCSNSDTEHDDAARQCRDDVANFTCRNEEARTRCANLGCDEIDTSVDGECDVYLSAMTEAGIQHVVDCTNDGTGDAPGGTWGTPPAPPGPDEPTCGQVFLACVNGTLQPE